VVITDAYFAYGLATFRAVRSLNTCLASSYDITTLTVTPADPILQPVWLIL